MSHQLFNFQRFAIVMEYEEKPILPVPFTVLSHLHLLGKHCYRTCKGANTRFESGLKLVLGKFDMERLYDFEEEGVEAYLRFVCFLTTSYFEDFGDSLMHAKKLKVNIHHSTGKTAFNVLFTSTLFSRLMK